MTAVEWLIQQIDNEDMGEIPMWVYDFCNDALEFEKEQIMQAYKFNATGEPDGAEHYYEMFYKKYNQ